MKNWLLWSYNRGSLQYDVLCGLILITIFAIPPGVFSDRPDYMRLPGDGEINRSLDRDGNEVYTVKVTVAGNSGSALETEALAKLQDYLGRDEALETYRSEPVRDAWGSVAAYALWIK